MPTATLEVTPRTSLRRITVGIRHQRNFGILDATGKIVDSIARAKDSPFPREFFTKIGETARRERKLETQDGSSYLAINTDDLIFQYTFRESFDEAFKWVVERCVPYFVTSVLHRYEVADFFRLGIVFGHDLPAPEFISELASNIGSSKLSNPETLIFRLSKKLLVEEALIKKNVQDWRNVILTMNKKEQGDMELDVDIQHYFNPHPDRLDEFDFVGFFRYSKDLLFETYHPMLEQKFFPKRLEQK